jgi:hypothetical protein
MLRLLQLDSTGLDGRALNAVSIYRLSIVLLSDSPVFVSGYILDSSLATRCCVCGLLSLKLLLD